MHAGSPHLAVFRLADVAEVGIDANVFYDTLNQEGLNPTEVALQLGVKAEDLERMETTFDDYDDEVPAEEAFDIF